jgi:hypothetical protein
VGRAIARGGLVAQVNYSLFYGNPGRRVVGYDNERGKGDHRRRDGEEASYGLNPWTNC